MRVLLIVSLIILLTITTWAFYSIETGSNEKSYLLSILQSGSTDTIQIYNDVLHDNIIDVERVSENQEILYCLDTKEKSLLIKSITYNDSLREAIYGPYARLNFVPVDSIVSKKFKVASLLPKFSINSKDNLQFLPQVHPIGGVYEGDGVLPGGMIDLLKCGEGIHLITYLHVNDESEITFEKYFYVIVDDQRSWFQRIMAL